MKIAFLIMAHSNIQQLNCFIRQLLAYPESYIYIHLDSKAGNVVDFILKNERIFILPERYCLNWGDYSLIETTKYLLRYSAEKQYHDYYSLHSGVDMAIKPISELAKFLEKEHKLFYASCLELPCKHWGYGGGLGRIALKWPKIFRQKVGKFSLIRILRGIYGRAYNLKVIQKLFPVPTKKYRFYGGAEWFTASSECIQEMFRFLDINKDYDGIFKNAISSDEIYFSTIFKAIQNGRAAVNDNLCHTVWGIGKTDGIGGPIILTDDYIEKLEKSDKFFARKFDLNQSKVIVDHFIEIAEKST